MSNSCASSIVPVPTTISNALEDINGILSDGLLTAIFIKEKICGTDHCTQSVDTENSPNGYIEGLECIKRKCTNIANALHDVATVM